MPAGANAVPGKQGFQPTGRAAAEISDIDVGDDAGDWDPSIHGDHRRLWRAAGFGAVSSAPWAAAGFDSTEAASWRDAGFDVDAAVAWSDCGIDPSVAARAIGSGISSPAAARDFIECEAPLGDVGPWSAALTSSLGIEAEYAGAAYAQWTQRGSRFDMGEMAEWAGAGFTHAATAREWRKHGHAPQEARAWEDASFGPDEAAEWRALRFEPARADYFATRGLGAQAARLELATPRPVHPAAA